MIRVDQAASQKCCMPILETMRPLSQHAMTTMQQVFSIVAFSIQIYKEPGSSGQTIRRVALQIDYVLLL